MKVVIAGAGEVGYSVARDLADKHEVIVIEKDENKINRLEELNVNVVKGNAANIDTLRRAGVVDADLFLAVTNDDEVNLVSGFSAKKLGTKRVMVRVQNPEYADKPVVRNHPMGFDALICPQLVLASKFVKLVTLLGLIEFFELSGLTLFEVEVPEGSKIVNKKVSEVELPGDTTILAILRNDNPIIPRGDSVIKARDVLLVLGREGTIRALRESLGEPVAKAVVIVGAGTIGTYTARLLERANLEVKLIESDERRAREAITQLERTKVVVGDGTDVDFLRREEVERADVVIATTESDEKNLLIALLSKSLGAKRAFAKVERDEYTEIFERAGVDVALSPKKVTYHEVMRILQAAEVVGEIGKGMVIIQVECNVNKRASEIDFPENAKIAAIKRETLITGEDVELRKGDTLYIITTWDKVDEVKERLGR